MLFLLRIFFTGAFVWLLWSASTEASANLEADVANAGRFALAIVVGFVAALTWAPLIGESIAGPVTGLMTDGSVSNDNPRLVRWAKRSEARVSGVQSKTVVLEVEDTGSGIAPEVQERLFDPFFSTKENGTGLGLPIAAKIIDQHNGTLDFETQPGHGTTFRIVLPAAKT